MYEGGNRGAALLPNQKRRPESLLFEGVRFVVWITERPPTMKNMEYEPTPGEMAEIGYTQCWNDFEFNG